MGQGKGKGAQINRERPKEAERKVTTNKFCSKRNFPTIAQLACATHADEWAAGDLKSEFGQQQRQDDGASFQAFVVQQREVQCGQKGSGPKLLVFAAQGKTYKLFR